MCKSNSSYKHTFKYLSFIMIGIFDLGVMTKLKFFSKSFSDQAY